MYKVNEIFYTLQGEGAHSGIPAVFVRFSGCNLRCDSVFCLKLTVNPTYRNVETVMRCDIEPYWYNGHWLTQTGEYTQKYQTACGCDSTEVLRLTVTPTRRDTQRVTICEGQSYIFYGREIAQSGIYYDTVDVPYARQCVITVLDLGFQKPTVISNVRMDDVCADDDIWSLRTHFTGSRPDVFTLLFDDNARAAGFNNIISQPFEDEITGRIPRKQNGDYIRPDYYSAQLILDNDVCASAGGEKYDIRFVVRYPSWIIEQNWNDVVDNKWYNFCGRLINQPGDYDTTLTAFNGCDSIVRVHLNVNPTYHKDTSFILCTGDNITFNHRVYTHGNTYIDTLHTQNGCNCDSIYDITIHEVHPFYHTETYSLCKDSTMEWHGTDHLQPRGE